MKKILFILFPILLITSLSVYVYKCITKPTISVILATYNRADLLPRAIDSILSQTYKDFELIIVDDGSSDKTDALIHQYMAQDNRIRYIKNPQNKGVSYSRNIAINNARGDYIAIIDSDDQALPNRLEKQLRIIRENPSYTAISGGVYSFEDKIASTQLIKWNDYTPVKNNFLLSFIFANTFSNAASMFKRDFINDHNIRYNETYIAAEDYDFWVQILQNGGKLLTVYDPFTFIRYHSSNSNKYYEEMVRISNLIHKKLLSNFFEPEESDIKFSYTTHERCKLLSKVLEGNKKTKFLPEEEIITYAEDLCPILEKETYFVRHFDFEDYIVNKNGSYIKWHTKEPVQFEKKDDFIFITLNEKKYRFKKHTRKTDEYHFLPEKYLIFKHPAWTDFLVERNKEKSNFCRFDAGECATLIKKDNNTVVLDWDNQFYEDEAFVYNKKQDVYNFIK